jgi:hypothetical protein
MEIRHNGVGLHIRIKQQQIILPALHYLNRIIQAPLPIWHIAGIGTPDLVCKR